MRALGGSLKGFLEMSHGAQPTTVKSIFILKNYWSKDCDFSYTNGCDNCSEVPQKGTIFGCSEDKSVFSKEIVAKMLIARTIAFQRIHPLTFTMGTHNHERPKRKRQQIRPCESHQCRQVIEKCSLCKQR